MTIGPLSNQWKIYLPPSQKPTASQPPSGEAALDDFKPGLPLHPAPTRASTATRDGEFLQLLARDQSLLCGVGGGVLAGMAALWIHSPPPSSDAVSQTGSCRNTPLAVAFDQSVEQLTGSKPGQGVMLECSLMEQALADPNATVAAKQRLGGGINTAYLVTLSNGARGVFKSTAGEHQGQLRNEIEVGRQGPRELAAYVIDKAMGHYGRVPPTVHRTLEGQDGFLLAYVHNARIAACSPSSGKIVRDSTSVAFKRMSVLDEVLGNLDRHSGNWMVTAQGQPVPIDHGLTMPLSNGGPEKGTREFFAPRRLDADARRALERLVRKRPEVESDLATLLDPRAVQSMYARVDALLQMNQERNV